MNLFRRILLSLFPSEFQTEGANPIGMYVGFISPKQFFSVVHRRVIENYKFNMYDIALDPFEMKIGVGDKSPLTVQETDFYFGYGSASNLNGWGFYTPGNCATLATLVSSLVLKDQLEGYNDKFVIGFFLTIYLFSFVMVSRIKVFPEGLTEKESYERFIETFFQFFSLVLKKRGVAYTADTVDAIKNAVLQKIHLFFFLFHFYKRLNGLFYHQGLGAGEFYKWVFYDELHDAQYKTVINHFILHANERTAGTVFSPADKKILGLILPVDVHLKYLFQDEHRYDMVDIVLGEVFEDVDLEDALLPFIKNDDHLEEFLGDLMKHRRFKKNFFKGAKKMTQKKFRLDQSYKISKEIDTFMSTIQESGSMEGVKVPDQLKKESKMMDRLLNFYVTFVSGIRIGRGDTFFARMFRKPLVDKLLDVFVQYEMKNNALRYYGSLLFNYTKNVYYYKHALKNIRQGNQSFKLPLKNQIKQVHSNRYILKLFDEFFVNTLLQDINKKAIKLSVTNNQIITLFKAHIGDQLSDLIPLEDNEFVRAFYDPVLSQLSEGERASDLLVDYLTKHDHENMKDNLYTLDQRVWRDILELVSTHENHIAQTHSDISIIGLVTTLRETVLGLFLFATASKKVKISPHLAKSIFEVYCIDILTIPKEHHDEWIETLTSVYRRYENILDLWLQLDDNKKFLGIFVKNRKKLIQDSAGLSASKILSGEDIVWLRGFLKTVTYYNKRYLIPK